MSSLHDQIVADLGRKITERMQADLQREIDIARRVLPVSEIVKMMMIIAAGVHGAACLLALQVRKQDTDPSEVWDVFSAATTNAANELKPGYLDELAKLELSRNTKVSVA